MGVKYGLRPRVIGGDARARDGRIAVSVAPDKDGVISSIAKWIPIEVIAFYQGITTPFGDKLAQGLWYAIVAETVVTFLWIAFATENSRNVTRLAWRQIILSCTAFVFLGDRYNQPRHLDITDPMVAAGDQSCSIGTRCRCTSNYRRHHAANGRTAGLI